jgi:UDPglucose 6-dehydrogenase
MNNISIIGIGRLGLCVALVFEKYGYNILGCDVVSEYVDKINNKTLFSHELGVNELLKESKNFKATTSIEKTINFSDIIFIYVATPSTGGNNHYDHTTLGQVLMKINEQKVLNKHIIIGCTIMPGYIDKIGKFLLSDCINTTLNYNPEFIAQGDIINGIHNADFILIGEETKESGDKLEDIYKNINNEIPICRMSPISAEITKLSVNCFVTTKIAFANMIGDVADNSPGADKYDILNAVGTDSRIGKKYLKTGYGFGGPCFPRDNRALGSYIKDVGIEPLIPKATDQSNILHKNFQVKQILKENKEKTYKIYGACYKENSKVPIIEESQKIEIGKELYENNFQVIIRDSKYLLDLVKLEYGNIFKYIEEIPVKILFITTMKPMIKDFYNEQYNSVLSWKKLRLKPTIIIFGNDEGVSEFCKDHDIINMNIKCNEKNVPYISEMLKEGYKFMGDDYDYITYVNADILLKDDFCDTIEEFHKKFSNVKSCLLTCVRYNIFNYQKLNFNKNWEEQLEKFKCEIEEPTGIDIFLHKKNNYINLPDFAIARYAFDSYMLNYAIINFDITVDITNTCKIYHHYGKWYQNSKPVERKLEECDIKSFEENKFLYNEYTTVDINNINMCDYFTHNIDGDIYFIKNLDLFNDIFIGNNIPLNKDLNDYLLELKYKTLPLLRVYYNSLTNIIKPLVENDKDTNIIIPKTFGDYINIKNNKLNICNNQENISFLLRYIKNNIENCENLIDLTEKYSRKQI